MNIKYSEKHDAYYYADTGEWVEPRCADMACLFCEDRPAKADQEGKLMNEQEPWVILTSPKRIWLDIGFDPFEGDDIPFIELADVTWSADNATGYGIEYVRADVPQRQPLTDEQKDAARYRWLRDNSASFTWIPSRYNENTVSGFSAFGTGYLGFGFEAAVDLAIEAAHGIKENT